MTNEANVFGNGGMEKMKEKGELRKRCLEAEKVDRKKWMKKVNDERGECFRKWRNGKNERKR
jgi:hypothetical protein